MSILARPSFYRVRSHILNTLHKDSARETTFYRTPCWAVTLHGDVPGHSEPYCICCNTHTTNAVEQSNSEDRGNIFHLNNVTHLLVGCKGAHLAQTSGNDDSPSSSRCVRSCDKLNRKFIFASGATKQERANSTRTSTGIA